MSKIKLLFATFGTVCTFSCGSIVINQEPIHIPPDPMHFFDPKYDAPIANADLSQVKNVVSHHSIRSQLNPKTEVKCRRRPVAKN
jgi:hypothetical protein